MENKGCTTNERESDEGVKVKIAAEIGGGMKKMLISVRKAVESCNMIIFGANVKAIKSLAKLEEIEDNVIVGVKSGTKGVIKSDSRGNYMYPITMTRKKKKETTKMDIGFAGPNQSESVAEEDEDVPEESDQKEIL